MQWAVRPASALAPERGTDHRFKQIGLTHETQVVRMRAVGRAFCVVAEQVGTAEVRGRRKNPSDGRAEVSSELRHEFGAPSGRAPPFSTSFALGPIPRSVLRLGVGREDPLSARGGNPKRQNAKHQKNFSRTKSQFFPIEILDFFGIWRFGIWSFHRMPRSLLRGFFRRCRPVFAFATKGETVSLVFYCPRPPRRDGSAMVHRVSIPPHLPSQISP